MNITPNPSTGSFAVNFSLAAPEVMDITVTDMAGRVVIPAARQYCNAGNNNLYFTDALTAGLSDNMYLIQLKGAHTSATRKLVLMR